MQPRHAQRHVFLGRHVQVFGGEAALVLGGSAVEVGGPDVLLVHPMEQRCQPRVGRGRREGGFRRQKLLGEGHAEPAHDDGSQGAARHVRHAAFEADLEHAHTHRGMREATEITRRKRSSANLHNLFNNSNRSPYLPPRHQVQGLAKRDLVEGHLREAHDASCAWRGARKAHGQKLRGLGGLFRVGHQLEV